VGITTAPEQEPPLDTTPSVIVNVGVMAEARPDKQLYVPLAGGGTGVDDANGIPTINRDVANKK
jgi:hypothetical protein